MLTQLLLLLLIALGWKTNREQLTSKETRMVLMVFVIYAVVCIGQSSCEASPGGNGLLGRLCQSFNLTEYVLQSLILLAIIVAINMNITASRAMLNAYPWSSLVPLQMKGLASFNFFRLAFLIYLLFPTLLVVIRVMLVSWPYSWIDPLLRHALLIALYVAIALAFAPTDKELWRRPFSLEPWRAGRGPTRAGNAAGGGVGGGGAAP